MGPSDPLGQEENSDNSGEDTDSSGDSGDEGDESSEESDGGKSSDDEGSEEAETSAAGSEKSDDVSDEKSENKDTTAESMSEGGKANGQKITAVTDSVSEKSSSELLDNTARDRTYAIIPKIQLENVIVDYKKIMTMYQESLVHQRKMCGNLYFETTKESLQTFLKEKKL
jgi:cobalamin biosynthesis protein CobT